MFDSSRVFRQKYFTIIHFGFWFLLSILALSKAYVKTRIDNTEFVWESIIAWPFAYFFAGWIVSNLIIFTYFLTNRTTRLRFFAIQSFAALFFSMLHFIVNGLVILLFERLFKLPESIYWSTINAYYEANSDRIIDGFVIFIVVLIGIAGLDYYSRYKQNLMTINNLQHRLISSELQTLKLQLKPHFLFNALNTIAMMVRREKGDEAVNMLSGLSDMMRNSLSNEKKQYVTVAEEMALISTYLKIEATRFQDRLKVDVSIDEKVRSCKIPNLILQPIVENAFKHGISKTINNALLEIVAKAENNKLVMSVFNTGSSLPADWDLNNSKGIGIINTTHRLRQMYNGNFKFLVKEERNGVLFKMIVPLNE